MVRNLQATTAAGLRKNRVTQKTRLRVVRGELDADAILVDDEEERNRVLASQGVDAEDANEHHLQAALTAADHCKHPGETSGKRSETHIPTPDAAGLVEAYESLYQPGKYKQPTTHLRFSETVEETVEGGLAGGFAYVLDERDAEWIDKNNQEARGEGTSASASASGIAEDSPVASTRSGRPLHSRSAKAKGKEPEQPGSTDHAHARIVMVEDEFELVMGLFEKVTEEKFPFIHLALDTFPPFSDFEPAFTIPLSSVIFARYLVPSSVPLPERLVLVARAVYPHWKARKIEREGKRIVPQLDYDDAHESSYNCFRRRDAKPVRRTRASSSAYTDKLVRLRSELQVGLELAKTVLERETLKKEAVSATRDVWLARCELVDAWKSGKEPKGPGMGVDEALLFDRERVVKKPGRIILGLNRRPSGAQSGSGTPIGDPLSPLTAHLDLSVVNLSTLSPQAYVAVQSAARERYREMQANVEMEMGNMRTGDNGWEDILDMPYQAVPMPHPTTLFKPFPPLSRPSTRSSSDFGLDPPATCLNGSGTSFSTFTPDPTPFASSSHDTPIPPSARTLDPSPPSDPLRQFSHSSRRPFSDDPVAERIPRSLRLRTGRGGRLHLDRRLHVRRPHPLLSIAQSGWPRQSSSSVSATHRCREDLEDHEAERWEGRDWCPERRHGAGKGIKRVLGEEYWVHESLAADRTSLGKRKRPDDVEMEEETIMYEKSGYGLGLEMCTKWEKGPAEEWELTPEPRTQGPARKRCLMEPKPEPERWRLEGRTAEVEEYAWRVAERWRYDSDVGPEQEDRFLLDDYQAKFMRTMVTLLDANDHEAIQTDPMHLALPPIPNSRRSRSQPSGPLTEHEPPRLTNMRPQHASQPLSQPQSQPHPPLPSLPGIPLLAKNALPSTMPPHPPPLPSQITPSPVSQRMDEQIRQHMARQSQPSPESPTSVAASGPPQTGQRISPAQRSPSIPTPSPVNGSQLKPLAFPNGIGADATVRVSSSVLSKSHTPSPQQKQQQGPRGLAVNGLPNANANAVAHQTQSQNQNQLSLPPGHAHGLNPHQYATLRNVFAECVPPAQQMPGRPHIPAHMQMNGVGGTANVNLQMGPGSLNLKLPPTRASQLRMNGIASGDVNGAAMVGGSAMPVHAIRNGGGSPVPHLRTPSGNGHPMTPGQGRASPLGHPGLSNSQHHHSSLVPLHATPPSRPTQTFAHQQLVGGAGQGHGYS